VNSKKIILTSVVLFSLASAANAERDGVYSGANFGGVVASKNVSRGFTAEANAGYQVSKYNAYQLSGMYGAHDNGWLMAEGLLKLPIGKYVTPYALLGVGYTHLNKSSGGADIGAGININITEKVSAMVQYKFIQTIGPGTPNANIVSTGLIFFLD
jgi:opacity protein-like surface antigen